MAFNLDAIYASQRRNELNRCKKQLFKSNMPEEEKEEKKSKD